MKNNKVLKSIPFFFLTSFFNIMIIPILTVFTVSFGIGAIGAIILGILRSALPSVVILLNSWSAPHFIALFKFVILEE